MAEALGEPLVDLGSNQFKNGWGTHNSLDPSPGMVLWDHLILRASAAMSLVLGANLHHKDGAYNEKHMCYIV